MPCMEYPLVLDTTRMNMKKSKRPTPYYLQPDYRLHEFNKRLQHKSDKVDQSWWDDLIREFFEDDATLFIQFKEKGHLRKYTIHRRLIPRYFRSLFDNGVSKVYFMVMEAKENYVNSTATLDCKHGTMVSHYGKPPETKVMTDGHLSIEFNFDYDFMRIRSWKFQIRENTELIPKSYLNECKNEQMKLEELSTNITECGMSPSTLQYLRIGVILEPMQELMAIQKANGLNPRDSLKSALYDKWQNQLLNQDFEQRTRLWSGNGRKASSTSEAPRGASKKRKPRKTPSVSDGKGSKKKSPSTSFPSLTTSDVMLVDEPMLMGGKFGDEDERVITRLENAQYRGSNSSPPDDLDDAFISNSSGIELPITNPINNPISKSLINSISNTSSNPISNSISNPISNPISNSVSKPVSNPISNSVTDPVSNPGSNTNSNPGSNTSGSPINNPMNNTITNQNSNPMTNTINNPISSQMSNPMSNPLGSPVGSPRNTPMNSTLNSTANNPMGSPINNTLSNAVSNPIANPITNPIGNVPVWNKDLVPKQEPVD